MASIPDRSLHPLGNMSAAERLAYLTGGGWLENIPRVLPAGLGAEHRSWPLPPLFEWIRREGQVEAQEMRRVFNLGYGLALFFSPADAPRAQSLLVEAGEEVRVLGAVVPGEGVRFLQSG